MVFADKRPSDFVALLTKPGIPVPGTPGIPLQQYVSAVADFDGNKEAEEILGPLQQLDDTGMAGKKPNRLVDQTRSYGRVMTGQGYVDDFKIIMTYIAKHLDVVKNLTIHDWEKTKGADGKTTMRPKSAGYKASNKYFGQGNNATAVLNAMVAGKVFGLDCIGFLSQYLVTALVWKEYKSYYPGDYLTEFKPVASLQDIRRLSVLVWGNYHIAIVDKIHDYIPADPKARTAPKVRVDICQSSAGGPQTNQRVEIEATGMTDKGKKLFKIAHRGTPAMPVFQNCFIGNMPGLTWKGDWGIPDEPTIPSTLPT